MSWSIGFDAQWRRDIGYGVPAQCDHPTCKASIDRGLAYVCGGEPYGGDSCGLYFCAAHLAGSPQQCSRCRNRKPPFRPKRDVAAWVRHKLTDDSWARWRAENPDDVAALTRRQGAL